MIASLSPPVGRRKIVADQREARCRSSNQDRYTRHEVAALRVGPVRTSRLAKRLHQLVDSAVQILVGPPLLVDLRNRMHHRRVMLAPKLPPNLRQGSLR